MSTGVLGLSCQTEYHSLKEVILCEPAFMNITNLINETQKYYFEEGINVQVALNQYKKFIELLKNKGINLIMMDSDIELPEQVFTRDVGFTLGTTLFVGSMAKTVRKGEEEILKGTLSKNNINYVEVLKDFKIEGGDVIIDHDFVFVGLSDRTDIASVNALQNHLDGFTVVPLPFSKEFLHLDCVFNVLSENEALIYPPAFNKRELTLLSNRYNFIEISRKEQFNLASNVLSLGNKCIVSLTINDRLNAELKSRGYEVIEIEFDEIIKSGGSFRCCTLPIFRSIS